MTHKSRQKMFDVQNRSNRGVRVFQYPAGQCRRVRRLACGARVTREEARPSSSLESRITYPLPGRPAPRAPCLCVTPLSFTQPFRGLMRDWKYRYLSFSIDHLLLNLSSIEMLSCVYISFFLPNHIWATCLISKLYSFKSVYCKETIVIVSIMNQSIIL